MADLLTAPMAPQDDLTLRRPTVETTASFVGALVAAAFSEEEVGAGAGAWVVVLAFLEEVVLTEVVVSTELDSLVRLDYNRMNT